MSRQCGHRILAVQSGATISGISIAGGPHHCSASARQWGQAQGGRTILTSLEIENFNSIAARQRIELAPLTLLFGADSACKRDA